MKILSPILFFASSLLAVAAELSLIPVPAKIDYPAGGDFVLDSGVRICSAVPDADFAAGFLSRQSGISSVPADGKIIFEQLDTPQKINADPEGYTLEVTENQIVIRAIAPAGFFYGAQTLLQILDCGNDKIAPVRIADYPRFRWRGVMLDSARHFQDPQWIKKFIDLLASQKINVFHWHLTDDQGWRIEIKKFPQLTRVGAWRDGIGFGFRPDETEHYNSEGRYGGFYSQEQIRELVAYARERGITIVPEIELPGHAVAALCALPQLGCTGGPYRIWEKGGVSDDVYCAGNEALYDFLEDVFDEVADLFPSKIIHIGGDECPQIRWKTCPRCQAKMRAENLAVTMDLQSYCVNRIAKFLKNKGRRIIGWDEILADGITNDAVIMSWRGNSGGIRASKLGHDVVMSPTNYCYFDYSQARTGEPRSFGGLVPLGRAYEFDPARDVPAEFQNRILGGQANLWSEYMPNEAQVEYMLAPRVCALAESVWSPADKKNYEDFSKRMLAQYKRFERAKWNYRKPEGIVVRLGAGTMIFDCDLPGATVAYTLDGSVPDKNSPRAADQCTLTLPKGDFKILKARVFLPDGSLGKICERYLNFPKALVKTDLLPYENFIPEKAVDGDRNTFFWANAPVPAGATFAAFFDSAKTFSKINCITGKNENGGGGDKAENAVLEISSDGKAWLPLAYFSNGNARANIPAGTPVLAMRIRFLKAQSNWLVVREFEIE
ncbi:MAG: family 20 glycosylhydrolase [Opitutales bacterium]|nr:family 20 glycosylhydrolase [Opitutales bacterium]